MSVAVIKWAPWLVQKYMEFVYSYLLIYQQIFSSYSALKRDFSQTSRSVSAQLVSKGVVRSVTEFRALKVVLFSSLSGARLQ